ncbi:hypothetical protein ACTA71_009765 [Dictyostelium dimigraforme]
MLEKNNLFSNICENIFGGNNNNLVSLNSSCNAPIKGRKNSHRTIVTTERAAIVSITKTTITTSILSTPETATILSTTKTILSTTEIMAITSQFPQLIFPNNN